MEKVLLQDLVKKDGVTAIAERLGCSPPAITKALKAKRTIFITIMEDGTLGGKEIKDFPSPHHAKNGATRAGAGHD